jgi:serine/threonine-protein kinase
MDASHVRMNAQNGKFPPEPEAMPDTANHVSGTPARRPDGGGQSLPDLTGRVLGDYQILRRLGVGGMGQVYLARQLSLKRDVALKLLRDDLINNPTALKRFQAEAEAVARLNHPNIVHIHQMGESDGLRFMALEYVEGRNLRDHLARKGPPDIQVTLSIIRQVAYALQQAHDCGIVHRDIKPENILVTRKVEVKVTDFGLSRYFAGETPALNLTQSGVTLGTPLYMSPEQVQGHAVDHRSDIYSLGVTCYHMLAGEPPFRGATAFDVALKHVQEQPQPLADLCPDLPVELCAMIHRMMAKNPADRYQSAREIIRDLARVRDGLANGAANGATNGQRAPSGALSLSGPFPTASSIPVRATLQDSAIVAGPLHSRTGWRRWAIAGGACLFAATAGVVIAATRTRPPEHEEPRPTSGLPDIRPPEKLVSSRERELRAIMGSRSSRAAEVIPAYIELGLYYVRERRLDEANEVFVQIEKERKPAAAKPAETLLNHQISVVSKLGRAIVLAYRDQPASAEQSLSLFTSIVNEKIVAKKEKGDHAHQLSRLLRLNPDLALAVSDALNRDAMLLDRGIDPHLEALRNPPKLGK